MNVTGRGFLPITVIAEMPVSVRRHFKVLYDASDPESVELVRRYEAGESLHNL
jgi:hypothetical protein